MMMMVCAMTMITFLSYAIVPTTIPPRTATKNPDVSLPRPVILIIMIIMNLMVMMTMMMIGDYDDGYWVQ